MKHHRILYRTLSALLCLGLCAQLTACGKKPVPKPGSSGPSAPSVSKKVYDDSLITEVYDEEDSFTDEYGAEYSYICHVPQLEADTPEAKAINWEIMESFGNDVQATLDAAESGETPNSQYMEVTWQSYWNDSLLSLSIRVLGWTSDLIDYAVYHYDFETGQRPDNLELLDRFHVDEGTLSPPCAGARPGSSIPITPPGAREDSRRRMKTTVASPLLSGTPGVDGGRGKLLSGSRQVLPQRGRHLHRLPACRLYRGGQRMVL